MNTIHTMTREDIKLGLRCAHARMVAGSAKRCDGRYAIARRLVAAPTQQAARLCNCASDGIRAVVVGALAREMFLGQLG
jgi:hypothetical protein